MELNGGTLNALESPVAQDAAPSPPQQQPAAGEGKFVEGKLYRDASGNTARYVNGQFVPVQ